MMWAWQAAVKYNPLDRDLMLPGATRQGDCVRCLMKTYGLSPAYCKKVAYRAGLFATGIAIVLVPVALWAVAYQAGGEWSYSLLALFPIAVVLVVCHFTGTRQLYRRLASYRLMLDGEELIRIQEGLPDVTILQDEVTEVWETPGVGLAIRTPDPQRVIAVPVGLEGYEELRGLLGNLASIRDLPASTARRRWIFTIALMGVMVGAVVLMIVSRNRWVVAASCLLLIALLVWSFIDIRRNPAINRRTKLVSWAIVLPLLAVVGRLVLALAGKLEG